MNADVVHPDRSVVHDDVWRATVDEHAPGLWRRLLAQAPYWQAADASDVTWLRLADSLDDVPIGELESWLDRCSRETLGEIRDCAWRTPSAPLGVLGDEPPDTILDAAHRAFELRVGDKEIARPNQEPGLVPAVERGVVIPWRATGDVTLSPSATWERTFSAGDISVDLVLFAERERRLVGMVRGADLAAATLRTLDGERGCDIEASGWFRVVDIPEGPLSVMLDIGDPAQSRRIVTEWRAL
ncbi:MAG: hypothetical protein ABFS21_02950 [Actinomycetota bacterium]